MSRRAPCLSTPAPDVAHSYPLRPYRAAARTTMQTRPASSVQRQFWLLQRLNPESSAYHVPSVFRINGHLDLQALESAFAALVARHECLRTTFEERDGVLFQRIASGAEPEIVVSVSAALPDRAEIQGEIAAPFDLGRGPLLRIRLWQTPKGEHVMAWTMHHSIVDLATKDTLSHELGVLYAAHAQGVPAALEEANRSYSDFAAAEALWPRSPKARLAEDYFGVHLSGKTPPLALPADRPRPPIQSHRGARVEFVLPPELGLALEGVASAWLTKPYLLLLAAFAMLLGRYSDASRVIVGVPFTNRRREEAKGTAGCFVNTLPVSIDVSSHQTFRQLWEQIRRTMLEHHRHQEIPFDQLLGRVRPPRDASRNPLYQAGFTFEHPMQLRLTGTQTENLRVHAGGAQLDVFLTMWQDGDRWWGHLEYCSDLFEQVTVERLVQNYLTLLSDALRSAADGLGPLNQLEHLHPEERRRVIQAFNETGHDFGRRALIHELFVEQASGTPNAVAVRCGDQRLTYLDLLEAAQGLAHELRAEGVRDGDRVGIYMPRSVEMVASVLAVLLSGAAYVPIDPDFPQQRIDYLLEDAQPRCVLAHPSLVARWTNEAAPVRCIDARQLSRASQAPSSSVAPDDAAYVIFTSGSTGRPKGVAVSHRAICNSMLWMQETFRLRADDVLIQTTPYSFDVSTWELLWVFIAGAQLEIPDEGAHREPAILANQIERAGVTTVHFVPSMLQVFLEQAPLERCRSLRRVLCIGEALSVELVRRFHAACGGIELHNLYGPTEAAVQASWWFCKPGDPGLVVPIGKPIANTKFYILDAQRRPVPIGVPGELYIGGVQVAIEYVNRRDLTSTAFVPDPFASEPTARMYRTGDLARWLPDGNVVFLGRSDFQVKVRGQRVELGEIESVMERHPLASQCVVVAQQMAGSMDAQLIAYVSGAAQLDPTASDALRAFAAARLPSYMVPNRFVFLDRFPLNSNGKVDRKRLPSAVVEPARSCVGARNDVERWLSEQWRELLEVNEVSIHDNFFDAGGTSLMATRLISRIRDRFCVDVPLVRLFEYPTIARLSEHLGSLSTNSAPGNDELLNAKTHAARRRALAQQSASNRSRAGRD